MKTYSIKQVQLLPVTLDEAWDFFSEPLNLNDITPPDMNFRIEFVSRPGKIYAGQLIGYRIRILPWIWVRWLTEITAVKRGEYFIDDQRSGPYALWHHQHHFRTVPGGVEMTDEVNYAVPYGWLGRLANRFFVAPRLRTIFAYRHHILEKKFARTYTQNTIPV